MQKSFDITIDDQQPINPNNSFAIYRGDNVAFNFTFQRGGISLDVDGATLRVFAKKIGKNGAVDKLSLPLFAEDFVATNTATFNSSQTCGDAGNYILSVLLVSSDDAVITSQCIYFELKENGYAGEYQPSADFRDEVLNASELAQQSSASAQASAINASESEANARDYEQSAQASANNASSSESNANLYSIEASISSNVALQSKEQAEQFLNETITARNEAILAKEQAQEISDPENRIGNLQNSVAVLQRTKSNRGELWFECGALATENKTPLNTPFSCVWTMAMTQEEFEKHRTFFPKIIGNLGYWTDKAYGWCINSVGNTSIGVGANNVGGPGKYNTLNIVNYLDGNPHIWSVVYNGTNISLYIDNVKKTSLAFTFESSETTNPLSIGSTPASPNQNYGVWGKFSRIKYFNFDMYADDAPYTITDYISGKDESPVLSGTLLSLEDYTFNGKAFDTSGNNNTATLTGVVKGTYDNAVEQIYQAFSSRIGNLTE